MSQTKHTTGPWVNSLTGIKNEKGELIAQAWCGHRNDSFGNIPAVTYPEMQANAKLISAAPEILEACIIALKAFDGEYAWWTHKKVSKKECARMAKSYLEKAIKKATE
jgi:hypothetical protein